MLFVPMSKSNAQWLAEEATLHKGLSCGELMVWGFCIPPI